MMALLGLAGCASAPAPAVQWVRMPAEAQPASTASTPAATGPAWQLMQPFSLPGHLDRDAVLLPQGPAGLQPLAGARWAEPLRDAVPRLLQHDLGLLLGPARVWAAPLPAGVRPAGQLRLEFTQFDVVGEGRQVQLAARWVLAWPGSAREPAVGVARFLVEASGPEPQALAVAHRQALWRLAQELAAAMR